MQYKVLGVCIVARKKEQLISNTVLKEVKGRKGLHSYNNSCIPVYYIVVQMLWTLAQRWVRVVHTGIYAQLLYADNISVGFLCFLTSVCCTYVSYISVPPDMCLLGCIFYITDYPKIVGLEQIAVWKQVCYWAVLFTKRTVNLNCSWSVFG